MKRIKEIELLIIDERLGIGIIERIILRDVIVEVIFVERIDIEIERLGMGDDSRIEIRKIEKMIKKLRKIDRKEIGMNEKLRKNGRDNIEEKKRIGGRRKSDGDMCERWKERLLKNMIGIGRIIWIGLRKIEIERIERRIMREDRSEEEGIGELDKRIDVDGMGKRMKKFKIVERRIGIVERKKKIERSIEKLKMKIVVNIEEDDKLRGMENREGIDIERKDGGGGRRRIDEEKEGKGGKI